VVRIVVYESERMLREWLAIALSSGGVEVVETFQDPESFLQGATAERPDLALADLSQVAATDSEGAVHLLRAAKEKHPLLPVVVISTFSKPDPEVCYREGAAAWVDTAVSSSEELIQAVQQAATGVRLFPFSVAPSGMHAQQREPRHSTLSDLLSVRERQVLGFIGTGADNLKIGAHLGISERTVKSHVTGLYRKTQVENRTQLALVARELGIRPPVDRPS
jgi:two-component system, NarL family, nitrate/nitrite response regulator NarL